MFQDIKPFTYHNEYRLRNPAPEDYIFISNDGQVLLELNKDSISLPSYNAIQAEYPQVIDKLIYLFSIDNRAFFLSFCLVNETERLKYYDTYTFREIKPAWIAFAGATAAHLARWYNSHKYCGKCASVMIHSQNERAVCCPQCGLIEYPKISPAVIVGVIDGENILLTKYSNRTYKKYALIAGFMEIGETLEDTVRREIMEEVGLKVKNIRYYKNQPWSFSDSILVGFFADLDGNKDIKLDENELSEAVWVSRDSIPEEDNQLSLTWDMIEAFRKRKIK